jgi:type VI secretion system secreted protein VgrG
MSGHARTLRELVEGRQHNRLLRLSFPQDDAPPSLLVVNKLDADESLSRPYAYCVELLSDDAQLELKNVQGKLLCIELVRQDGTLRYFTGFCFSFRLKSVDGAIALYEAELRPWLHYLSLRKDNYLFHGKSLRDQTDSIFKDYGHLAEWDWRVASENVPMTDACQFNESDLNYLSRRWEAAGLLYWFEHTQFGHKLVISDDSLGTAPIDGQLDIPFRKHGGATEENGIGEWSPIRHLMPSSVALASSNFKRPVPNNRNLSKIKTINRQGPVFVVESYEYLGSYGARDTAQRDRLARLRMEEIEAAGKKFDGAGNNRSVMPGRWFRLTGFLGANYRDDVQAEEESEFLILAVRHLASNNYLQGVADEAGYSNRLHCIRKSIPWRPGRSHNSTDTKIHSPQTATVVGPKGGDSIHVDEYGRVRVQFHWDRVGEYDDRSSAWVRMMSPWAGSELGAAATPRVGSEVCILFLDGNPDRPVIIGALPNAVNMPPWALPTQQALSGLRSRELAPGLGNAAKGRSNHLILDDTHQQIQAQLKSDHACSQLSLGHITRIDDNGGRKDARGEGWELASDAWGVARAGKGMLITTDALPDAASCTKEMSETLRRLSTAAETHAALADLATKHGAQEKTAQSAIADVLTTQNDELRGGGESPFRELTAPHLVMASAAGIEMATAQSAHIASNLHAAITTGKSFSVASRDSIYASAGDSLSLFVHKGDLKMVSALGKVRLEAQQDEVNIIARKVLALLSETDWVDIRGKKGVRLHGANSMLEIGETTQFFSASPVLFHGSLETLPSKTVSQAMNERPVSRFDQEVRFLSTVDNSPVEKIAYELIREDGQAIRSVTDASGSTQLQKGTGMDFYTIRYKGKLP